MTKDIIKRLIYCLFISLAVSLTYVWTRHSEGISEMDANGMEEYYFLLGLNACSCGLSFILSLTSFFNLRLSIRQKFIQSISAFVALPIAFFVFLVLLFVIRKNHGDNILSFLDLGLSSLSFCIVLIFQTYRFRQTIDRKSSNELCTP